MNRRVVRVVRDLFGVGPYGAKEITDTAIRIANDLTGGGCLTVQENGERTGEWFAVDAHVSESFPNERRPTAFPAKPRKGCDETHSNVSDRLSE